MTGDRRAPHNNDGAKLTKGLARALKGSFEGHRKCDAGRMQSWMATFTLPREDTHSKSTDVSGSQRPRGASRPRWTRLWGSASASGRRKRTTAHARRASPRGEGLGELMKQLKSEAKRPWGRAHAAWMISAGFGRRSCK